MFIVFILSIGIIGLNVIVSPALDPPNFITGCNNNGTREVTGTPVVNGGRDVYPPGVVYPTGVV